MLKWISLKVEMGTAKSGHLKINEQVKKGILKAETVNALKPNLNQCTGRCRDLKEYKLAHTNHANKRRSKTYIEFSKTNPTHFHDELISTSHQFCFPLNVKVGSTCLRATADMMTQSQSHLQ